MAEPHQPITLQTRQNDVIIVPRAVCAEFAVVARFLDDCPGDVVVPLPGCSKQDVERMVRYHELFGDNPELSECTHALPQPCTNFYKSMSIHELTSLLLACNFIEYEKMLHTVSIAIAARLRGRTPDEIRHQFGAPPMSAAARADMEARYPQFCQDDGVDVADDAAMTA